MFPTFSGFVPVIFGVFEVFFMSLLVFLDLVSTFPAFSLICSRCFQRFSRACSLVSYFVSTFIQCFFIFPYLFFICSASRVFFRFSTCFEALFHICPNISCICPYFPDDFGLFRTFFLRFLSRVKKRPKRYPKRYPKQHQYQLAASKTTPNNIPKEAKWKCRTGGKNLNRTICKAMQF